LLLDLHTHSIASDDGRAKVENYCQWIKSRDLDIDGFVLTEHRQFDLESDYSELAEKFGITILKGAEVETEYGHVLVFGVTEALMEAFDFTSTHLALADVLAAADAHEAIAIPCHPGRPKVGMFAHVDEYGIPDGVTIVETMNGGSRGDEDQISMEWAEKLQYKGIGGSDSHIVSHIGRCATRFPNPIHSETELVAALRAGDFEAVNLK